MAGRWYSIKEAAEQLGVSHDTVARLVARGELPALRVSERICRNPGARFRDLRERPYGDGSPCRASARSAGVPFGAHEEPPDLEPACDRPMRGTYHEISRYLSSAALLLERYGVTLRLSGHSDELEILEDSSGSLSFEILGVSLSDA